MDLREWINLQEALAWLFWPVVQWITGISIGISFLTGVFMIVARAVRFMTRPIQRGGDY